MKQILTLILICTFFNIGVSQTQISERIYFDFNQFEINADGQLKIQQLLHQTKQKGEITKVLIDGHTDNFGSDNYNNDLSMKRAKGVFDYVVGLGIKSEIVNYQAFGENQLIIAKGDKNIQKENRRVTITLIYSPKTEKIPIVETAMLSLPDLYKNTKIPYDKYVIQAGEEFFIDGKQGTRLQFLDNAFNHLPKGTPIEIRMTEYYSYSDMLLANLTTEIGDNFLSTAGMIYVEAFANGKPTNMTGEAYVWFPNNGRNMEGMQPYFGVEGEQGVIWERYAGTVNVSNDLRKNWMYWNNGGVYGREGQQTEYSFGYRYDTSSRWKRFWYNFLYGTERNKLITRNTRKNYSDLYGLDSTDIYKEFDKFSSDKTKNPQMMQAVLNYEIMSINKLGWINCDRFYDVPQEDKRILTINEMPNKNLSIKVLCKKERAIIAAYPNAQKYQVVGLPKDLKVTVIAIRTSNDKPELAIKSLSKIQDLNANELVFTAFDNVEDLRKAIKKID